MKAPMLKQAEVPPLDVDGVTASGIGTVLWVIAAVILWFNWSYLIANGVVWWLWTALCGVGIGVSMHLYCRWRRARNRTTRQ